MTYETLYDSLSYNISSDDLTLEEKETLISACEKFDKEKSETVYWLILHDHVKTTNPNTKVIYPYRIKQNGNKLVIKIDALPVRVKRILYRFVKLAEISIQEAPVVDN